MIEMLACFRSLRLPTIAAFVGFTCGSPIRIPARLTVRQRTPARAASYDIVVCARQPDSERLPFVPRVLREAHKIGIDSWGQRAESLDICRATAPELPLPARWAGG